MKERDFREDFEEPSTLVAKVSRRLYRLRWTTLGLQGVVCISIASPLFVLLLPLGPLYPLSLGVAVFALYGTRRRRRPSPIKLEDEVNSILDTQLRAKDRFTALHELKGRGDAEAEARYNLITRQLHPYIQAVDVKELIPFAIPLRLQRALYLSPITWIIALLLFFQPLTSSTPRELKQIDEVLKKEELPPKVREALEQLKEIVTEKGIDSAEAKDAVEKALESIEEGKREELLGERKAKEKKANEKTEETQKEKGTDESQVEKEKREKSQAKQEKSQQEKSQQEKSKKQGKGDSKQEDSRQDKDKEKKDQEGQNSEKGKEGGEGQDQKQGGQEQGEGEKQGSQGQGQQEGKQEGQQGQQGQGENQEGQGGDGQPQNGGNPKPQEGGQPGGAQGGSKSGLDSAKDAVEGVKEQQQGEGSNRNSSPDEKKGQDQSKKGDSANSAGNNKDGDNESKQDKKQPDEKKGGKSGAGKATEAKKGEPSTDKGDGGSTGDRTRPSDEPDAKRFMEEGEEGKGGLGGEKGYKDAVVKGGEEQFDTRFTEKQGKVVKNEQEAKFKTELNDITLEKPDPIKQRKTQQIPLEYRDLLSR